MTDDQDPRDYIDWDEGRDFPASDQGEDELPPVAGAPTTPFTSDKNPVPVAENQDRDPKAGDRIEVTGGTRAFTGIVVGADEMLLIVAEAPGRLTYIRRNAGSTDPHTWRCASRPVRVRIVTRAITRASEHQAFSKALKDLERRTR
jgi:hypothetical protein